MVPSLKKIEIVNYRSCESTTLNLDKQLTILVGANGAGKTNILKAIMLLKKIMCGVGAEFYRENAKDIEQYPLVKIKAFFENNGDKIEYSIESKLGKGARSDNLEEVMKSKEEWFVNGERALEQIPRFRDLISGHIVFMKGADSSFINQNKEEYLGYLKKINQEENYKKISNIYHFVKSFKYVGATQFSDCTSLSPFIEIEPRMASYNRLKTDQKRAVLDIYDCYKNNPEDYGHFFKFIGPENMGLVDEIKFNETQIGASDVEINPQGVLTTVNREKLIIYPQFIKGKSSVAVNQLSEGTFKSLAVIFYLITTNAKLFIFEEPEVCVHQGLLERTINAIKSVSSKKQIVVSTHSDLFLDRIEIEKISLIKLDSEGKTTCKNMIDGMLPDRISEIRQFLRSSGAISDIVRDQLDEG